MVSIVELIPLEVIEHIIDIVANNDWHKAQPQYQYTNTKACSLTCHTFLPRCRMHIFRSIRLYDRPRASESSWPQAHSFAQLITDTPEIADYVRELHYMVQMPGLGPFYRFPAALERLTKLETLTLSPEGGLFNWEEIKSPSRSTLLHLLHAPTIVSLRLICIQSFTLSDLIPCTNLKELNLKHVLIAENDEIASSPLPSEAIHIRRLELRYAQVQDAAKMVKQKRPDGRHILELGELNDIALSIGSPEDTSSAVEIIQRTRGLVTIHITVGHMLDASEPILSLISSSLETLRNLSLTFDIYKSNGDPLCGLYRLFQMISGKNHVEVLEIFIRIPKHLVCSIGDEWGLLEQVILSPGWSALTRLDLRIIANSAREDMWLEKALRELPQTQFPGLTSSRTLKFNFSVLRFNSAY